MGLRSVATHDARDRTNDHAESQKIVIDYLKNTFQYLESGISGVSWTDDSGKTKTDRSYLRDEFLKPEDIDKLLNKANSLIRIYNKPYETDLSKAIVLINQELIHHLKSNQRYLYEINWR